MFSSILLADQASTYIRFSRLQSFTEWWQWLLLIAACLGILAYVTYVYLRDSVELPRGTAFLLLALRICALLGILFFYFDLERRTEKKVVKNSRVALLIDTSQSMGLQDPEAKGTGRSRMEQVVAELIDGTLIKSLRAQNDIVVYRFDQMAKPSEVAAFSKFPAKTTEDSSESIEQENLDALRSARYVAFVAFLFLILAAIAGLSSLRNRQKNSGGEQTAWSLLVSMVLGIAALVILAVACLRTPNFDLEVTFGLKPLVAEKSENKPTTPVTDKANVPLEPEEVDWRTNLMARGVETRIGDAVEYLVSKERGGSIAGIVLISDGGHNAGQQYTTAIASAQDAGIPIYAIGMGSNKRPMNVRVVDIEAPQRVFPGDGFSLTAILQAFGMRGRLARVELLSSSDGDTKGSADNFEEEKRITLGSDGEALPVKFEITPKQPGKKTYKVRVTMPEPDHDPRDNEKAATVQVIERKQRVLLFAGGPSREYQFLRNMLYRDKETTLDVILQSGTPGISQESNELLFEFPKTADDLFKYDCIVAFDPDWESLNSDQVKLLDRWVAEEAGGLVVMAGPVKTPQWSSRRAGDDRIDTIKALYPVIFYYQGSATLSLGRFGGDRPWPLQFTRDGMDSEFLWLADSASESEQTWSSFDGVYGYYAVKDPKPGARVYARFSDPETEIDGQLPIYLAGQFYGAGRVFFQASGEMWRLRSVGDSYFETFYTKLVRWASQGRLLRDSTHGVLLVDKDRCLLGDQIEVRAMLKDAQRQPLLANDVTATIIQPDGKKVPLKLLKIKDSSRDGMFGAQFAAQVEGDYRIELAPPHADVNELLSREVRVRVPALEIERPERNDPLLKEITQKTNGEYFIGLDAAMNRTGGGRSLANVIEPQDQTTTLPGKLDDKFERALMTWLLGLICGVLCVEWLIRRLSKLA